MVMLMVLVVGMASRWMALCALGAHPSYRFSFFSFSASFLLRRRTLSLPLLHNVVSTRTRVPGTRAAPRIHENIAEGGRQGRGQGGRGEADRRGRETRRKKYTVEEKENPEKHVSQTPVRSAGMVADAV